MKRYAKYFLIFIICGAISVSVYYWQNNSSDNKNNLPAACGENEDITIVNNLSINHIWKGRGELPKTINEDGKPAHYQEWQLPDSAKVRVIEERYSKWGIAHEALGKRLKDAQSVCQISRKSGNKYIDSDGTQTRIIALFSNEKTSYPVEILSVRECDGDKCSFLTIIQAHSLAHALAKEEAYHRIDF